MLTVSQWRCQMLWPEGEAVTETKWWFREMNKGKG